MSRIRNTDKKTIKTIIKDLEQLFWVHEKKFENSLLGILIEADKALYMIDLLWRGGRGVPKDKGLRPKRLPYSMIWQRDIS
jgi:hypothetical protein